MVVQFPHHKQAPRGGQAGNELLLSRNNYSARLLTRVTFAPHYPSAILIVIVAVNPRFSGLLLSQQLSRLEYPYNLLLQEPIPSCLLHRALRTSTTLGLNLAAYLSTSVGAGGYYFPAEIGTIAGAFGRQGAPQSFPKLGLGCILAPFAHLDTAAGAG